MPAWLNAWAGDNAGEVQGRQPYEALVSVNYTDADLPMALFQKGDLDDGTPWYFNIWTTCLTPGVMDALVTSVDYSSQIYQLGITPYQWSGGSKAAWAPGVHLVSIAMLGANGNVGAAIATVVVPPPKSGGRKPLKLTDASAMQVAAQRRMLAARR